MIGALALAWRLIYLVLISRTACLQINMDPMSDMEAFHRWALQLVAGDWLDRAHFHPFHPWQQMVADRAQWESWYGAIFHQEPLYPYALGLLYLLAPGEPASMIVMQLILGAAGCGLIYLAARRIAPEAAARWAGVLAALYGPHLYYESLLLRDALLIPIHAAMLWAVLEARDRIDSPRARWWHAAAGGLCGLSFIAKASVLPFFVLYLGWMPLTLRRKKAVWLAPALCMLAGFLAPLAPVVLRNAAVGAPLLSITTRGPIEFINGNHLGYRGTGWFDGEPEVGLYAREILADSGGKLLPTIAAVTRDGLRQPWEFALLQLRKAAYLVAPFEMPNNASFGYFRHNSLLLRYGALSFFTISPLALLGLLVSLRTPARFVPLYLFLGAGAVVTIAFYVIARFRAPLMPGVLILAGLGIYALIDLARRRALGGLGLAAGVVLVALGGNAAANISDELLIRPQDHLIAIAEYRARGEHDRALREALEGWKRFGRIAAFPRHAADLYLVQGSRPAALEAYRATLRLNPSDAEARRLAGQLETGSHP